MKFRPLTIFKGLFFFTLMYLSIPLPGQGLSSTLELQLNSQKENRLRFRTVTGWFSTDFSLQTDHETYTELRTWAIALYPTKTVTLFAGAQKRNGIAAFAFNPVFSISSPFYRYTGTSSTPLVEMSTTLETERVTALFRSNRVQFAISGPLEHTTDLKNEVWWSAFTYSHKPSRSRTPSTSLGLFSGTRHSQETEQDTWFSSETAKPEGRRWHTLLQSGFRWKAFNSTATLFLAHKTHQQPGAAVRAEASFTFPIFRISGGFFGSSAHWQGLSKSNHAVISREYLVASLGRQQLSKKHSIIIECGMNLERTVKKSGSLVSPPEQHWLIQPGVRLKNRFVHIECLGKHRIWESDTKTTVRSSGSVRIPVKTSLLSGRWEGSLSHEAEFPDFFGLSGLTDGWILKAGTGFQLSNVGKLHYSFERYKKTNKAKIQHRSSITAGVLFTARKFLITANFEWKFEHQFPHNTATTLKTVIQYK